MQWVSYFREKDIRASSCLLGLNKLLEMAFPAFLRIIMVPRSMECTAPFCFYKLCFLCDNVFLKNRIASIRLVPSSSDSSSQERGYLNRSVIPCTDYSLGFAPPGVESSTSTLPLLLLQPQNILSPMVRLFLSSFSLYSWKTKSWALLIWWTKLMKTGIF